MPESPTAQPTTAAATPRPPTRWVVLAFAILLALALVVIASSVWILHLA
jgi:hypothetical protein